MTGSFRVRVGAGSALEVLGEGGSAKPLWATTALPFLSAARGRETVQFSRGAFRFSDELLEHCVDQTLDAVEERDGAVVATGWLVDCGVPYELRLSSEEPSRLTLSLQVGESSTGRMRPNRLGLSWVTDARERFYGFGAQYSAIQMAGRKVPIWSQEQGHGRGLQPLSNYLDLASPGASGEWHTTYTAVPFFASTSGRGLSLDNAEYLELDFTQKGSARVDVFAPRLTGHLLFSPSLAGIVSAHARLRGTMGPLPAWADGGVMVRAFGGEAAVHRAVDEALAAGVPLSAVWIEDWCGTRRTLTGTRLWWNWEPDATLYPSWPRLVASLRARGVRVVTYFNPYLADASGKSNVRRNLYSEARRLGHLVARPDGQPYLVGMGGFDAALVDLSSAAARAWLGEVIREQLELGVSGWMADFGEALPYDARLTSGVASEFHNRYAEEWAALNRAVVEAAGARGEALFFVRSGTARSPAHAPLFWLGDQLVSWDDHDGLKTVVRGLLSSGLSGYALNHSDIGGYLSVQLPFASYERSRELHQRWAELAAFTAFFRAAGTNRPEANHQWNSDLETSRHFVRMANLFVALGPYRRALAAQAQESGLPLVRPLLLSFPDDPAVAELDRQFLLGEDLLVAPVLDAGSTEVRAYLPAGEWVHLWTGQRQTGPRWLTVPAPVGRPAAFLRAGSGLEAQLRSALP